jgi:hypothetical protein
VREKSKGNIVLPWMEKTGLSIRGGQKLIKEVDKSPEEMY